MALRVPFGVFYRCETKVRFSFHSIGRYGILLSVRVRRHAWPVVLQADAACRSHQAHGHAVASQCLHMLGVGAAVVGHLVITERARYCSANRTASTCSQAVACAVRSEALQKSAAQGLGAFVMMLYEPRRGHRI